MDFIDSWLRCPYDGKRLILVPGDFDLDDDHTGETHVHECLNCDYRTVA